MQPDRRSSERHEIELQLSCRVPARPCYATLVDLSYHGCHIEVPHATVELGGTALIDFHRGRGISGSVVWVRGPDVGIRFHRRLPKMVAIALGIEAADLQDEPISPPSAAGGLRHWVRELFRF